MANRDTFKQDLHEEARKRKIEATLGIIRAVADALCELKEVPETEFYVRLGDKLTINQCMLITATLEKAKVIEIKNHVIRWIGPS
jgi:hypothetical protein